MGDLVEVRVGGAGVEWGIDCMAHIGCHLLRVGVGPPLGTTYSHHLWRGLLIHTTDFAACPLTLQICLPQLILSLRPIPAPFSFSNYRDRR